MGADLNGPRAGGSTATGVDPPGPARRSPRRAAAWLLAALLLLTGCTAPAAPPPAFDGTDVMFLQMSLAYAGQGDQVAALAESRARSAAVRDLATRLRAQWRTESGTMQRWLLGWEQPLTADPGAGAHAGHGDLHSLRPADLADLAATPAKDFDRTAMTLLVGHLHNCVEVARTESAGGRYPPARAFATTVTAARQDEIQQMLRLLA